jgi:hypothetical protein
MAIIEQERAGVDRPAWRQLRNHFRGALLRPGEEGSRCGTGRSTDTREHLIQYGRDPEVVAPTRRGNTAGFSARPTGAEPPARPRWPGPGRSVIRSAEARRVRAAFLALQG